MHLNVVPASINIASEIQTVTDSIDGRLKAVIEKRGVYFGHEKTLCILVA